MGLKRGAGRHLYRAGQGHLDVRAKARTARPDSGRVLVRPELGDGPDRWGPPIGGRERRRGRGGLGRKQKERAGGESWAGQWKKKEEKKKKRWAGLKW